MEIIKSFEISIHELKTLESNSGKYFIFEPDINTKNTLNKLRKKFINFKYESVKRHSKLTCLSSINLNEITEDIKDTIDVNFKPDSELIIVNFIGDRTRCRYGGSEFMCGMPEGYDNKIEEYYFKFFDKENTFYKCSIIMEFKLNECGKITIYYILKRVTLRI